MSFEGEFFLPALLLEFSEKLGGGGLLREEAGAFLFEAELMVGALLRVTVSQGGFSLVAGSSEGLDLLVKLLPLGSVKRGAFPCAVFFFRGIKPCPEGIAFGGERAAGVVAVVLVEGFFVEGFEFKDLSSLIRSRSWRTRVFSSSCCWRSRRVSCLWRASRAASSLADC